MEHNHLDEMGRALEMCLKDSRKYPDVVTQFKLAFRMLKKRRNGDYSNEDEEEASTEKPNQTRQAEAPANAGQTESNPVQPSHEPDESPENPTESNPVKPCNSGWRQPVATTPLLPDAPNSTEIVPLHHFASVASALSPESVPANPESRKSYIVNRKCCSPTQSNPVKPITEPELPAESTTPSENIEGSIRHSVGRPSFGFVIPPPPPPTPSREELLAEADQCLWQMKTNFEPWDLEKLRQLYSAIPPLWDDVPLPSYLTDQTPDQLRQQAEQCVWRMRNNFEPWNNEVLRRVFSLVPPEKQATAQQQP